MGMFAAAKACSMARPESPRGITKKKGTPFTYRDSGTSLSCCARPAPANPTTTKRQSIRPTLLYCTFASTNLSVLGPALLPQHSRTEQGPQKRATRVEILVEPRMCCQAGTYICNFVLKKCKKVRRISAGFRRAPFAVEF